MAMFATEEAPPTKIQLIDYNLCLKCQGRQRVNTKSKEVEFESVTCPKRESYQKFLDYTKERSVYGNFDFVQLDQRLQGVSAEILEE